MTAVKPMLAKEAPKDLSVLSYPLIVQPKFDGIRALIVDGKVQSRSGKLIPNAEIQAALGHSEFNGLDGELLVGDPTDANAMQATSTFVMAPNKTGANWAFYVFDKWDAASEPYTERLHLALNVVYWRGHEFNMRHRFVMVEGTTVEDADEVATAENGCVLAGYEGAILRDPRAPYKHGRSGTKGPLLKVKRFIDFEAVVIGVEERMHNANEAKRDAFGRTERSTTKAGLVPAGDLGALICQAFTYDAAGNKMREGVEFKVGTGFSADERVHLWDTHVTNTDFPGEAAYPPIIGRIAKVKSFPVGVKDAPRFPTFLGFRDPLDMS